MSSIVSQTSVEMSFDTDINFPLKLELQRGVSHGDVLFARLYPDVPAKIIATAGTVREKESRSVPILYELLKFDGSDRASPKYPIMSDFTAIQRGMAFNEVGEEINPMFWVDGFSGEVVASQPFYGGIQIQYKTTYKLLEYRVERQTSIAKGSYIEMGMLMAFYAGSTAMLDMSGDIGNMKSDDFIEAYRVISPIVLDLNGSWEAPKGWPENTDYEFTSVAVGETPDPDASFTDERPHEIGYINPYGEGDHQVYYVDWLKPMTGRTNYHPEYEFRRGNEREGFEDAFAAINWAEVETRLTKQYPGIKL